jgi:hypothetical protein
MSNEDAQKTCFVVMGFGKKTDFETGRTLDLDKSYQNMIKPAVEEAGLKCIRADEIVHSGLIDVPMYEQLLNAAVVVADLSTSNKNAFYELGVRHALRPHTTVVISEDGIKVPFDVNHIVVRQYRHLGEDIGFAEVMRFRKLLKEAITEVLKQTPPPNDSPVYTFLNGLTPPQIAAALKSAAAAAPTPAPEAPAAGPVADLITDATHSMLMQQVDEAQKKGDFIAAKNFLSVIRTMKNLAPGKHEDPYIIQRLALVTYKSKYPTEEAALKEAHDLLLNLNPATSNDTETLGLWGAVHKRFWDVTQDPAQLDEAVRGYERGFYLRNDYYNGINLAYVLNVRASKASSLAEAIADFIRAQHIRREVIQICQEWLETAAAFSTPAAKYWAMATLAEAQHGVGDHAAGDKTLEEAFATAPAEWMKDTTRTQIERLKAMLGNSPLTRLKASSGGA